MLKQLAVILCAVVFGCSSKESEIQEIGKTLANRAQAINSKDISRYASAISTNYNDKGKDFAQLRNELKKSLGAFEQIAYEAAPPSISVDGVHAEAVSSYRMKVTVNGKELTLNGTEHLRLVKESGGWKIHAGI